MPRIFIWILALLFGLSLLLGAQYSNQQKKNQETFFTGSAVMANPLGDLVFVDSTNGRNGDSGADPRHAVATLTYALTVAEAGDTIILAAGGSETVTATIAANLANVKIVCAVDNPDSGFTIAGAGTLDLITVSAADVCISGLNFTHTGATSSAAGILTTAAADQLRVENCAFDHSAITTTFTGFGVEITDDCNYVEVVDCHFRDCHRGIIFVTGTDKNELGSRIEGCTFWVGQATAFGIHANPTGTVKGLQISDCLFRELDGDGGEATDAWDGSDGADAASGPILFGAAVDQYSVSNSYAETALSVSFDNLNAVNAGAAGELILNKSGSGGDEQDTLNTINTQLTVVEATGTADIDISESDYTGYITLLTITPAAGQSLVECVIDLDYNKATTGFDTVATAADTLDVVLVTKIDGTNYRTVMSGTQITANGDGSLEDNESGERFIVGLVGVTGTVQVKVKISTERDDAEIPYRVLYRGAAPTITPVAAG